MWGQRAPASAGSKEEGEGKKKEEFQAGMRKSELELLGPLPPHHHSGHSETFLQEKPELQLLLQGLTVTAPKWL